MRTSIGTEMGTVIGGDLKGDLDAVEEFANGL